ncbi:Glycosyl hydrolases family 28 [Verrucomicrobium sp. GAS474]|uniref:glycoside hydrolase family 28 protein n=1 Tax=Verrucomicrobium sp. GAS474 TaxID=1882831 RepID=UPI00087966E0|nr:glycosyl hydrolase family 28 protein [Verrucomicrobium sp. GAS474]SDU05910.1 Glycosyl hydrolases family 28 [Verrucomicrobium sp. GAS474]
MLAPLDKPDSERSATLPAPPCASGVRIVPASTDPAHTRAIQAAIDACAAQGEGKVVLEPGLHRSGTIVLRSGVTLHLEKDAILSGSTDVKDYLRREGHLGARINGGEATALIFAEKAERIALTGEGTIDGSGQAFWRKCTPAPDWAEARKPLSLWIPGFEYQALPRPRALVLFADCREVRIEGVHLRNSPAWTVHLLACDSVEIRDIVLRGELHGSNTDGIDLDACRDVLVENCDIFTGDDAIALKNTNTWGLRRPSRNITVRGCRLRSTTHGFTVGTETKDDFENIVLADSSIEQAGKWWTLTGIGLSIVDGGTLRNVLIRDVVISDSLGPIQVRLANAGREQETKTPGRIEDIVFENVRVERAHGNCLLMGLKERPLKNVVLKNVDIQMHETVDSSAILAELPEMETEFPPSAVWRQLPSYGLYCRHIEGLAFSRVSILPAEGEKRPAFLLKNVSPFDCTGLNAAEPSS